MDGQTVHALGETLGIDKGQVSRIASGKRLPDLDLTRRWLDACHVVEAGVRAEVEELLEEAHASTQSWRAAIRSGSLQHIVRERLDAATTVCSYQPVRVPGLLQTLGYARLVLRTLGEPGIDPERSARDRTELSREALARPGRSFRFVIGERVLSRDYGYPGMLAEQRARIDEVATLDHVEVCVLPESLLVPEVPFTLYDQPRDDLDAEPLVSIELPFRGHTVEGPDEVARYRDLFGRLRADSKPMTT